ncbi:uncharacterized protein LOC118206092, partial [Stegodyphus dumicola]|uniref:uncharacterized protein LOC118206092 n=1 Tax=Stegodyphus dumicola TaxID=202533 RepID=UPI0015B29341
ACLRSYKNKIQAEVAYYPPPKKGKIETNEKFNKEINIKFENPATTIKEAAHSSAGTVLDENKENKATASRAKRKNSKKQQEIPIQRPQQSVIQQPQISIYERPQQSAHQRPQQSATQRLQKSIYQRNQQSAHQRPQQFKGQINWPEIPSYVETNTYLKNPFELFDQNLYEDLNFEEDENNVPLYFYNCAISLNEILTIWVKRKLEIEFLKIVHTRIPVEISKKIRVDYM